MIWRGFGRRRESWCVCCRPSLGEAGLWLDGIYEVSGVDLIVRGGMMQDELVNRLGDRKSVGKSRNRVI